MCGLIGMFGDLWVADSKPLNNLFVISTLRGMDSTGILCVNDRDKGTDMYKDNVDALSFLSHKKPTDMFTTVGKYCVMMGHTRWATRGAITRKNSHPFRHGPITLAHNGGISNPEKITDGKFEVDSEHIAHAFANEDYASVLKKITGAYCLTWYDERDETFRILRNWSRPMTVAKNKHRNTWYYASEAMALEYALKRNNVTFEDFKELPVHHMLSYKRGERTMVVTDVTKQVTVPVVYTPTASGYQPHVPKWASRTGGAYDFDDGQELVEVEPGHWRMRPKSEAKPKETTVEAAIKRAKTGKEVMFENMRGEAFLEKEGYRRGDRIHFCFDKFKAYNPTSSPDVGWLIGYVDDDGPLGSAEIRVHSQNRVDYEDTDGKLFSDDRWYSAEITNCRYDKEEGVYLIYGSNLMPSKPLPYTPKEPQLALPAPKEDVPPVEDIPFELKPAEPLAPQVKHKPRVYPGPNGTYIEMGTFTHLTKGGCAFCNAGLMTSNVVWMGNSPICRQCNDEMEYDRRMEPKSLAQTVGDLLKNMLH